jgi:hypothetical protein
MKEWGEMPSPKKKTKTKKGQKFRFVLHCLVPDKMEKRECRV